MTPNVPIPTDSIYKFAALFGLALIIAVVLGVVYIGKSSNDEITTLAREYHSLEGKEDLKEMQRLLQKRIDIASSDRQLHAFALGIILVIGATFSVWGFKQWGKKIQPLHDRLLELQVAEAEHKHLLRGGDKVGEKPSPPAAPDA